MLALVEFGLLDGDDSDSLHEPREAAAHAQRNAAERISNAQELYASGGYDDRIRIYLRSRGIELTSPILKFSEHAPHRLGAHLPAMLAPVVSASGELTGVHLTYLRPDGGGKADLPKEFQRECRGVIRGGAIRLAGHDPDTALIIGEGDRIHALRDADLWPARLVCGVRWRPQDPGAAARSSADVIIAADNDAKGAGQRNAMAAYDRWTAEGRSVRIKTPPDVGDDFNDVLMKRRPDARH